MFDIVDAAVVQMSLHWIMGLEYANKKTYEYSQGIHAKSKRAAKTLVSKQKLVPNGSN
jgi:hypothetical protein